MDSLPRPLTFCLLLFAGWFNRHQQAVIEYLLEENRVLRAVNGFRRLLYSANIVRWRRSRRRFEAILVMKST
jgi:hypothetical protein